MTIEIDHVTITGTTPQWPDDSCYINVVLPDGRDFQANARRLAAMEEIVAYFAFALAAHELADGSVPDDTVIWTGYEFNITAGMIRRAVGKESKER